jgi:hypothetical protein
MSETMTSAKTLPIPCAEEPGVEYLRDGFTAAYLFRKEENRLFLLLPAGTMTEIDSPAMRELIPMIGERTTLREALMLLAADRESSAAIA